MSLWDSLNWITHRHIIFIQHGLWNTNQVHNLLPTELPHPAPKGQQAVWGTEEMRWSICLQCGFFLRSFRKYFNSAHISPYYRTSSEPDAHKRFDSTATFTLWALVESPTQLLPLVPSWSLMHRFSSPFGAASCPQSPSWLLSRPRGSKEVFNLCLGANFQTIGGHLWHTFPGTSKFT